MSSNVWRTSKLLFGLLLMPACSPAAVEPAALAVNEDICSQCKMAVSSRQFAAQVVTTDGKVDQFDDIGCLVKWLPAQQVEENAGLFVGDYATGEWLRADQAVFVQSDQILTPMRSGLVAVRDEASARRVQEEHEGRILSWEQVAAKGAP